MNPMCEQGAHQDCDGASGLDASDQPIPCVCVCHAGQGPHHTTTRHAITCALLVRHAACTCGLEP